MNGSAVKKQRQGCTSSETDAVCRVRGVASCLCGWAGLVSGTCDARSAWCSVSVACVECRWCPSPLRNGVAQCPFGCNLRRSPTLWPVLFLHTATPRRLATKAADDAWSVNELVCRPSQCPSVPCVGGSNL